MNSQPEATDPQESASGKFSQKLGLGTPTKRRDLRLPVTRTFDVQSLTTRCDYGRRAAGGQNSRFSGSRMTRC